MATLIDQSREPRALSIHETAFDLLGRAAMVVFFSTSCAGQGRQILRLFASPDAGANLQWLLKVASNSAVFLFVFLIVALTLFRLRPLATAPEIGAKVAALLGTYAFLALPLVTPETGPGVKQEATGLFLLLLGFLLSAYVISFLGRSFSIMAEARRLVTWGPYGIVRHPLYLTELLGTMGIALLHLSWASLLLLAFHWSMQLRRMYYEEKVLRSAFPEYAGYAERVPRVMPDFMRGRGRR